MKVVLGFVVGIREQNMRKGILDFMTFFVNEHRGKEKSREGQRRLLASETVRYTLKCQIGCILSLE